MSVEGRRKWTTKNMVVIRKTLIQFCTLILTQFKAIVISPTVHSRVETPVPISQATLGPVSTWLGDTHISF